MPPIVADFLGRLYNKAAGGWLLEGVPAPARACSRSRCGAAAAAGLTLAPPPPAAVLELLLARAGSFADEAAEHRYLNQLRLAGDSYDHITSTRWGGTVLGRGRLG